MMLDKKQMEIIEKRMDELSNAGVEATKKSSGELNMSGCATGYCMAWA